MFEWIDGGLLAGLSATLAFWFLAGTVGMAKLTWRYRERFANWSRLGVRDRADAILNVSLFGILFNATYQRAAATYAFAFQEWKINKVTLATAPIYLPWSLFFMAGFLWWMCLETFGPSRNRVWWAALIFAGLWLGGGVAWRFR